MSVYFITARDLNMVKIGHGADPHRRRHSLQIGCPSKLRVEALVAGGVEAERVFHRRFSMHRVRGEWFSLSPEIETVIAAFPCRCVPRQRKHPARTPNQVIDAMGGTTAVSRLTKAPTSTVHSWRKIGIPESRMAHLRMIAAQEGFRLPADAA